MPAHLNAAAEAGRLGDFECPAAKWALTRECLIHNINFMFIIAYLIKYVNTNIKYINILATLTIA